MNWIFSYLPLFFAFWHFKFLKNFLFLLLVASPKSFFTLSYNFSFSLKGTHSLDCWLLWDVFLVICLLQCLQAHSEWELSLSLCSFCALSNDLTGITTPTMNTSVQYQVLDWQLRTCTLWWCWGCHIPGQFLVYESCTGPSCKFVTFLSCHIAIAQQWELGNFKGFFFPAFNHGQKRPHYSPGSLTLAPCGTLDPITSQDTL